MLNFEPVTKNKGFPTGSDAFGDLCKRTYHQAEKEKKGHDPVSVEVLPRDYSDIYFFVVQ